MATAGAESRSVATRRAVIVATRDEAPGAELRVAGLTVLERAVKQAARLGYSPLVAADGSVEAPPGIETQRVASAAEAEALAGELGAPLLRADVVRPQNTLEGGLRVTSPDSRRTAEDEIFRQLLRSDLGLVARWLNKPISFRITRWLLCRLPITPNQVTVGAALIGFIGCAFIAHGGYAAAVFGFALAHLQSILDGCDGELARVRFQTSPIGEWLDTLFDDALNLAICASTGIGLYRHTGNLPWLWAGLGGCAMLLTYNIASYVSLWKQKAGGELMKMKWWFAGSGDVKQLYSSPNRSPFMHLFALGRRDVFVLAWALLALANLVPVVMVWALLIAGAQFVLAVGQIVYLARGSR